MSWLILYLCTALLWGVYASAMSWFVYGADGRRPGSLVLNFLINTMLCPLAILWALLFRTRDLVTEYEPPTGVDFARVVLCNAGASRAWELRHDPKDVAVSLSDQLDQMRKINAELSLMTPTRVICEGREVVIRPPDTNNDKA